MRVVNLSQTFVTMLRNAEAKGIKDAREGKELKDNPYKRFKTRQCWRDGWLKGKRNGVS